MKEIQAELSSDSVSYDNGRHSDMVRRADDMSRVWDRFLFRVENRKHVLSVAWSFFKYINDVRYCIKCMALNGLFSRLSLCSVISSH